MPVDVTELTYTPITLTASDFNDGRDDNTSLSAGTVGEIAEAEIGQDGQLSGYRALQYGQPASNNTGDRKGNEPYVDLQDGGAAAVADTVEYAFGGRKKASPGVDQSNIATGWTPMRNADNSDPAQRKPLPPKRPIVSEGRLAILLAKDETTSVTVDRGNSSWQVPALGGD